MLHLHLDRFRISQSKPTWMLRIGLDNVLDNVGLEESRSMRKLASLCFALWQPWPWLLRVVTSHPAEPLPARYRIGQGIQGVG